MSVYNNSRFKTYTPANQLISGSEQQVWNAASISSINVSVDSIADNDLIYYDETNEIWVNGQPSVFNPGSGTAAAPTYSFSTDPDTGLYRSAANTIGFSGGGAEVATLSDTALTLSDGTKFNIEEGGAAPIAGTATLAAGTATIATEAVTANSIIIVSYSGTVVAGNAGFLSTGSLDPGVEFVINSSNVADDHDVNWFIIN